MIHIFTTISDDYIASTEFNLALRLFRRALPNDNALFLLEAEEVQVTQVISQHLYKYLQKNTFTSLDYVLLVTTPWLFLGDKSISILQQQLAAHPDLSCILPTDNTGYRDGHVADYTSLRGFENFVKGVSEVQALIPYDGRDPKVIMLRMGDLQEQLASGHLPDNIFEIVTKAPQKIAIELSSYVHFPDNYYEHSRSEMAEMIPDSVHSILDVGCATGRFGAGLKQNRDCHITGIDINPTIVTKAKQVLNEVVIADVFQVQFPQRFDCVTCLDSLEHFTEPDKLLRRICDNFLKPGGYFLTSLPNIGHWSMVEDLLAGRWDYLPVGLLCNTHYHFFTLTSIERLLIDEFKFNICQIEPQKLAMKPSFQQGMRHLEQLDFKIDHQNLDVFSYHILAKLNES